MPSAEAVHRSTPLIAALLRGELPQAVLAADSDGATGLAEACVVHGVHGVLYHQFTGDPERWRVLPEALSECLENQARADQAWELAHRAELAACLAALAEAGVDALILKGTALAYSLYPVPSIRARGDTDLLLRAEDVTRACDVLAEQGYARDTYSQVIGYEITFRKKDRFGLEHLLDVHWRLSSHAEFAALFAWDEAQRKSVALPALGTRARGLGHVHALLHSCIHRAVHFRSPYYVDGVAYQERNRLIWLYDIGLLAKAFDSADWSSFIAIARERGVSALCRDALGAATQLLAVAVPAEVLTELARPARAELSAQLLSGSEWRGAWVEFRAQRNTAARLKYLRDLFLPDRAYMQRKYPGGNTWRLPYLYVRRVYEGVQRRMRRYR